MSNLKLNHVISHVSRAFPTLITDAYENLQYLGTGSFGTVSTATRKTDGMKVCLKEIDAHFCTDTKITLLKEELEQLINLSNPNLIGINTYIYCPDNKTFYIETCYCDSTLLTKLNECKESEASFTETEVWEILYGICKGLLYLHSTTRATKLSSPSTTKSGYSHDVYIHGNLKLTNVGFHNGTTVLLDYAMGSWIDLLRCHQDSFSSSAFIAPEAALGGDFNPKSDIWSLGIIAIALLRGEPEKVLPESNFVYQLSPGGHEFTDGLRSFIEQCLNISAPNRISIKDAILFIENICETVALDSPPSAESPTLISSINADVIDGIHEHVGNLLIERDACNHSALDLAIQKGNIEYIDILVKYLDNAGACLQLGPRPHVKRVSRYTNLMKTALLNKPAYIDEYLDTDVNCIYGEHGMTALMIAASMGHVNCVKKLIREAGVVTAKGWTALMYAVRGNHVECVSLLRLEMGIMTKSRMRACDLSEYLGYIDCAKLLQREKLLCVGDNCRVFSEHWYNKLLGSAIFEQ